MKFTDKDLLKLDDFFEKFFKTILNDLEIKTNSEEELNVLEEELAKLFSTTLFEAATEVLETDEIHAIEAELELNFEANPFDYYFAMAINKESFVDLVNEKMTELTEQVQHIYKHRS